MGVRLLWLWIIHKLFIFSNIDKYLYFPFVISFSNFHKNNVASGYLDLSCLATAFKNIWNILILFASKIFFKDLFDMLNIFWFFDCTPEYFV